MQGVQACRVLTASAILAIPNAYLVQHHYQESNISTEAVSSKPFLTFPTQLVYRAVLDRSI